MDFQSKEDAIIFLSGLLGMYQACVDQVMPVINHMTVGLEHDILLDTQEWWDKFGDLMETTKMDSATMMQDVVEAIPGVKEVFYQILEQE